MSTMWIIRLSCVFLLFAMVIANSYFLRNRQKHQGLMENTAANLLVVIVYNALHYIAVALPSGKSFFDLAPSLNQPFATVWYSAAGILLAASGVAILIATVRSRRSLGSQTPANEIHTGGTYALCRHPIYAGIVLISLGIAVALKNLDGLMVLPLLIGADVLEATFEERLDMVPRFGSAYGEYRKSKRPFGPAWSWIAIAVMLSVPLATAI